MNFIVKHIIGLLTVTIILISTFAEAGQWVYRPMSINGKKGDLVMSRHDGQIADLVSVLGCYWSHVGMLVDNGYTIRHNTMYIEEVPIEYNLLFGFIKTTPKRMNPERLSNGLPGIISEGIDEAYNGKMARFSAGGGAVLKPASASEPFYRSSLTAATDKMNYIKGYYRQASYINMFQQDYTNQLISGRGSHCSGAVWYANYFAGKRMNVAVIDKYLTGVCAEVLYNSTYNMIRDEAGWFGRRVIGVEKIIGSGADERISNQICNTFGFDRSADTTSYWRGKVPQGIGNAPDHLLLTAYKNPSGKNPGVQTESSSFYGSVEPLQITNGYWFYVE